MKRRTKKKRESRARKAFKIFVKAHGHLSKSRKQRKIAYKKLQEANRLAGYPSGEVEKK